MEKEKKKSHEYNKINFHPKKTPLSSSN